MKTKILNLAYELCEIDSSTYEEINLLLFVENWLIKSGLLLERIHVAKNRYNIFAYKTPKKYYSTIFCTHLDTVKPYIAPHIKNQILWGRGSCDAKSIAAAMIYAVLEQINKGHDDLALLLTVGEEESSDGAKIANAYLKQRARYLVIGEPTELKAASAQKGSLVFDIISQGKEAHSSLAHLGDSATHKLIKYINKLINHAWPHSQEYGETLLNIGHISGGQARNILAKSACAQAIMRITKEPEEIILLLKAWAEAGLEITIKSQCEPFKYIVPEGFHSFIAGFGSDAPYLSDVAQGAILVGPGSLSLAHKEDEHISADEMVAGFEAYEAIAAFGREGDVAISNYTKNLCINVDDNS